MKQAVITQEINTSQHQLASYASCPSRTKGRLLLESESISRSVYRRDCDRIIHSTAFRRLEYKTQVFVNHEGDHYRTRLTHSLEVAQIARSISRNLSLCEDLAEALALAHDLGHTPFGHAGEDALNEAAKEYGGFCHNTQSLKILTQLEHKYARFDGLNLTWETLEGIVKHNGPLTGEFRDKERYGGDISRYIKEYDAIHDLELDQFASIEAQIAAFADDIAYHNHDMDDGLRAGLLSIEELRELPLLKELFEHVEASYPEVEQGRLVHEVIRRMMYTMVMDLTSQTLIHIDEYGVETSDDVRQLQKPLVGFSDEMEEKRTVIKRYLMDNMYQHYKVCRMTSKARRLVKDLFGILFEEPKCLPGLWRERALRADTQGRADIVIDFIAGMTDRFAMDEHKRLFNLECKT